ncbi:chemotaxis protein CheX [Dactylosporangium salmoneum]|uniref:Chemotaxis phosphatase CheX-like domain-containing protein n=1 Tax=Dactylosporangium salmoneum TaxID=53361 RepID=A0ABN3FB97_9ACTN
MEDRNEPPITPDQLHGIIWQVWTAYLGSSPTSAAVAEVPQADAEITASVCIAGAWLGHVVLRSGLAAAAAIAAAMLDLDPTRVKPDDIQDATGELMNITAGNLKSLLPQPSHLALPQVVVGRAEILWPGTNLLARAAVGWSDHRVTIEILHGEAPRR